MLRVGILGKTDSARRKREIVVASDCAGLADASTDDPRQIIEASELVVLTGPEVGSRAELATLALRRGRHVFSDWPIAADAESARRLSQTADESGVELAVNRPDRLHPGVLALREKAPKLTDVTLVAGRHYRFENLLSDAVDLCLFLNGGSGIHRYEAEAVSDGTASVAALSFAFRFPSGTLALGHIRKSEGLPVRKVFAAAGGWSEQRDLLDRGEERADYDPSTDESCFVSCIDNLAGRRSVQTPLHDLEETIRSVENILTRMRGLG